MDHLFYAQGPYGPYLWNNATYVYARLSRVRVRACVRWLRMVRTWGEIFPEYGPRQKGTPNMIVRGSGYRLHLGDCIESLPQVKTGKIALILTDPPFGVTDHKKAKWNNLAVEWDRLWSEVRRVRTERAPTLIMATQPFTTEAIVSNIGEFRYCWIWVKSRVSNAQNARKMPMKGHLEIPVFAGKSPVYHPQGLTELATPRVKMITDKTHGVNYGVVPEGGRKNIQTHTGYPSTVIKFPSVQKPIHPTQKPVELLEWLIRTYTDEGDVVLDPFMGSGSTGVAALGCGRKFVGMEMHPPVFELARGRIEECPR